MVLRVFAVGKNPGRRSKCQKGSLVVVSERHGEEKDWALTGNQAK